MSSRRRHRHRSAFVLGSALLAGGSAHAAGYYVDEIGARSVARGGANIVNPQDPSAMWLNPAALTLVTGPQLQIDLNLVFLTSSFVRDCGGVDNGCAPPAADTTRSYAGGAHTFNVPGGSRPTDNSDVGPASAGSLGRLGTNSRFDGSTTTVRNQAAPQPVPRLFASLNLDTFGLDGFAAGVFAYAPSSGDYRYGADEFTRYTMIDRDMLEVFYGMTLAYRYGNWFGIGASLQGVTSGVNQTIALSGDRFGNEIPEDDLQIRINALQHLIPSGNVGIWSNPGKALGIGDLEFAASAQLPRTVKASGPLTIESLGSHFKSEFIDSELATIDADNATATVEFVLPPFYRVGARYGQQDVLHDGNNTLAYDVEADVVYEQWSTYDHVFIAINDLSFSTGGGAPTPFDPIVQPKDWQDAWSARVGGTVALWDRMLEVHGGAFYESNVIPNTTYSMELVEGDKVGLGTGVSARLHGVRLDVGYGHIFYPDRVVGDESIVYAGAVAFPSPIGVGENRTRVAMGRYAASYDMVDVALTMAFDEMLGIGVHAARPTSTPR